MNKLLEQIAMIKLGVDPRRFDTCPHEQAHARECLKASLDGAPPPTFGTKYAPKESK